MSFNEEKEEQIMESSYSKTVSISGLSDKGILTKSSDTTTCSVFAASTASQYEVRDDSN